MKAPKWIRTATEARRRLGYSGHPPLGGSGQPSAKPSDKGRLARIHEIALDLGIAGPTLRNYLNALAALESFSDPRTAQFLSRQSAVGVMAYYRWARRAPRRAEQFLDDHPYASLTQLLTAEGNDRWRGTPRHGARVRPEFDNALVARLSPGELVQQSLGQHPEVELGPYAVVTQLVPPQYKFAGLDRLIMPSPSRHPETMAPMTIPGAIILPTLAILQDYARRSREIWWRASSASGVCPLVLLVFPGPAARRHFLSALPQPNGAGEGIFAGLSAGPRAGTGTASRSIFFRTGAAQGLIVVTSLLTLERDVAN